MAIDEFLQELRKWLNQLEEEISSGRGKRPKLIQMMVNDKRT